MLQLLFINSISHLYYYSRELYLNFIYFVIHGQWLLIIACLLLAWLLSGLLKRWFVFRSASVHSLATPFGSLLSGPLTETIGRRGTLQLSTFPLSLGWIIIGFSRNVTSMLVGRVICGLSVGLMAVPAQVQYLINAHNFFSISRLREQEIHRLNILHWIPIISTGHKNCVRDALHAAIVF